MKRILALAALAGAALCAGCSTNAALVRASDQFHKSIGAEYLTYVEADPALQEGQKAIRRQAVASFGLAIQEAKK